MTRKFDSKRLVIATHNAGKLKEISALLAPYGIECLSAGQLGLPEPEETGTTFVENALIKAHAAAKAAQLPALADDSGLSVNALDGRPGVYTADWAERQWFEGPAGRDWYMAMGKVEGLGYDPVFVPEGRDVTFAQLDPEEKHSMSHRADAFAKLVAEQFGS